MPDEPEWLKNWKFAQRIKRIPKQIATDIKETAYDLRDEPSEVPYRVKQRINDYIRPRHKVEYPSPRKPK